MELRRFFLRVMLWSLAAAAGMGVLAMLFFQQEVVWRVVGTAGTLAAAAGLLLSLSMMMDKKNARESALLGMGAVIIEFLLALGLIWDAQWLTAKRDFEFTLFLSMLWIGAVTPPAMFFLRIRHIPYTRLAGSAGVALAGIVLAILLAATWSTAAFQNEQLWGTAASLSLIGPILVALLVGMGVDFKWWRFLGLLAGLIGLAQALYGVWTKTTHDPWPLALPIGTACFFAHANLVLLCSLSEGQHWLRKGTIASAAITAITIDFIAYLQTGGGELVQRVAGAAGILTSCGSLALIVLDRINRKTTPPPILHAVESVTLHCPGCNKKQTLPAGDAQCPNCRLLIFTKFTEPHCPHCGYLTYLLKSDRCPECGNLVNPIEALAQAAEAREHA